MSIILKGSENANPVVMSVVFMVLKAETKRLRGKEHTKWLLKVKLPD